MILVIELNGELSTKRTKLRKYLPADREVFADLFTDKEVVFFMGGPRCEEREDAYNLFDKTFQIYDKTLFPDRHFEIWAIEHGGAVIGHFELKKSRDTYDNELEIVYLLNKDHWGKGLMPEVLKEVNDYANKLGCRLIATVNPENENSMRVLKKIGIEKDEWITDEEGRTYKVILKSS